jgi:hypothetical protein
MVEYSKGAERLMSVAARRGRGNEHLAKDVVIVNQCGENRNNKSARPYFSAAWQEGKNGQPLPKSPSVIQHQDLFELKGAERQLLPLFARGG